MKNYFSVYYVLLILFYGVAMAIAGAGSMPISVLLETALLAISISILRIALFPEGRATPNWVLLLWLLLVVAVAIVFALLFGWFASMQVGVYVAYGVYIALVFAGEQLLQA